MSSQIATPAGPAAGMGTAGGLLDLVRAERETRDAAEVRILLHALDWAHRHVIAPPAPEPEPVCHLEEQPTSGVDVESALRARQRLGLPELAWHAGASFAAALSLSTMAGDRLLRDALTLSLRLPRVFARVVAGEVPVWRARQVADAAVGQPSDVVTYLDQRCAPVAHKIGTVGLDRIIDAAMLALYPEEREIKQLEDLDARFVRLFEESINHTGIADMVIRGDWADLAAFDDTLSQIATLLGRDDVESGVYAHESFEVRKTIAVGILADPARALALLSGEHAPSAVSRVRVMKVVAHLSEANLVGMTPVAADDQGRGYVTETFVRWAGRPDTAVHVQPIRHCGGCADCDHHGPHGHADDPHLQNYQPSGRNKTVVLNRDRRCMFPYCTRPSRRCDLDHRIPFDHHDPDSGGPTCACNLTPLCRHHHRLKTHAAWSYTTIEPGVYLWTDRYGQQFLTTRDGTEDVTSRPDRRSSG